MAFTVQLTFDNEVNKSCAIGDKIYHALITNSTTKTVSTPVELGEVVSVSSKTISYTQTLDGAAPTTSSYYFFVKKSNNNSKTPNITSLVGYYAEVEMKNESTSEVELYQVGSQISESSK